MLRDFNLLVTTSRGNERQAISELQYLLNEIGDVSPEIRRTGVSGLVVARTSLDPFATIEKLRALLHECPYEFRFTLRIMPIEKVVQTDLEEIEKSVAELGSRIADDETFRITVEKRFTEIRSKNIIDVAAAKIRRKVNLTKPDRVLLIEIVGRLTGLSILKPTQILSVMKEKVL